MSGVDGHRRLAAVTVATVAGGREMWPEAGQKALCGERGDRAKTKKEHVSTERDRGRVHCMSSFGTIPWYGNFQKYGMYHTFQIANLKKKYG